MVSKILWPFPAQVGALQTTRRDVQGQSLNMKPAQQIAEQMNILQSNHALPHPPKMLKQVHGNHVVELTAEPSTHDYAHADACWTRQANVLCTVMTADCLPVLVSDRQATVVAAIHCGWRSLAAGIIAKTFERLAVSADDLIVWLGPCISAAVYQVGADMVEQFLAHSGTAELGQFFIKDPHAEGKFLADLQGIARQQWRHLGVTDIHASKHCTVLNNDLYYSWRLEKTPARMASMIWLKL